MRYKPAMVKSVVERAHPITTTVIERAVVPASPRPAMVTARIKATQLSTTDGRVKSPVETLEKGVEMQSIFNLPAPKHSILSTRAHAEIDIYAPHFISRLYLHFYFSFHFINLEIKET